MIFHLKTLSTAPSTDVVSSPWRDYDTQWVYGSQFLDWSWSTINELLKSANASFYTGNAEYNWVVLPIFLKIHVALPVSHFSYLHCIPCRQSAAGTAEFKVGTLMPLCVCITMIKIHIVSLCNKFWAKMNFTIKTGHKLSKIHKLFLIVFSSWKILLLIR